MENQTKSMSSFELPTALERALTYARVSGDDSKKDEGNIRGQLEGGRNHCTEKKYSLVAELFEDPKKHTSGYETDLPVLNQIRDMALRQEFDVLVVRELDRLSRNLAKQLNVEEELRRYGVRVEYWLYDYPDTSEGRLNRNMRGVFAEYEREKITERMIRGRERISREGIPLSGCVPFGFNKLPNKRWEKNEAEAFLVESMHHWVNLEGLTLYGIATRLDELGIERQGKSAAAKKLRNMRRKKIDGKLVYEPAEKPLGWTPSAVRDILTSETYIGNYYYGKNRILIPVPPIVDEDLFKMTQRRLTQNRTIRTQPNEFEYLLSGQCKCAACGNSYVGYPNRYKTTVYLKYACGARRNPKTHIVGKCYAPIVDAKKLDGKIWDWLREYLSDPERLQGYLNEYNSRQNEINAPILLQIEIADSYIQDTNREIGRLLDGWTKGLFTEDEIREKKFQLNETLTKHTEYRASLEDKLSRQVLSQKTITDILSLAHRTSLGVEWADANFQDRRRLVIALKTEVLITPLEDGQAKIDATCILGGTDFVYDDN